MSTRTHIAISKLDLPDNNNQFVIQTTGDTLANLFTVMDDIASGQTLDIEQAKLFSAFHTKLALAVLKHRLKK